MGEVKLPQHAELLAQLEPLDEHTVYRDSFLVLIEDAKMRGHLVAWGAFLYQCLLECAGPLFHSANNSANNSAENSAENQPRRQGAESVLVRDLRATANDLAYTRAFLAGAAKAAYHSALTPQDSKLALFAHGAADRLAQVEYDFRRMLQEVGAPP